jgi:hypothetical protein
MSTIDIPHAAPRADRQYRQGHRAAPPPDRIEIGDEEFVRDEVFCDEVLAGCTRKTAKRYEAEGLPFLWIAGIKYRPLNEGKRWLTARVVRKQARKRLRGTK